MFLINISRHLLFLELLIVDWVATLETLKFALFGNNLRSLSGLGQIDCHHFGAKIPMEASIARHALDRGTWFCTSDTFEWVSDYEVCKGLFYIYPLVIFQTKVTELVYLNAILVEVKWRAYNFVIFTVFDEGPYQDMVWSFADLTHSITVFEFS